MFVFFISSNKAQDTGHLSVNSEYVFEVKYNQYDN